MRRKTDLYTAGDNARAIVNKHFENHLNLFNEDKAKQDALKKKQEEEKKKQAEQNAKKVQGES